MQRMVYIFNIKYTVTEKLQKCKTKKERNTLELCKIRKRVMQKI